jgi:hypothetical protein
MPSYKLGNKIYSEKEIGDLIAINALSPDIVSRLKNDPASTSLASTQMPHGPGQGGNSTTQAGLFSDPRVRPQRFSALARPRNFLAQLQLVPNEIESELTEILTGQLADAGTDATGWCDNAPTPGDLKVSTQLRVFGKYLSKINLNAIPNIGKRQSYGDVPGEILNSAPENFPYMPDVVMRFGDTRDQLQFEMYKLGNSLQRSVVNIAWQGVAGQNAVSANDGWWYEPNGFDALVKTGYTDIVSGTATPAADSVVQAWGGGDIGGNDSFGRNIVESINDLWYAVNDRASQVGMGDTNWVFVMRKEQFRALVEVYACTYATYRCQSTNAGQPIVTDGMEVQRLRTEMASGQFLLIDGVPVPVQFDEGIALTRFASNPNVLQADIFLMPLSWGGRPLTYMQYFKMDNPYATDFANFVNPNKIKFMNNGLFIAGERSTGLCVEYFVGAQMRPALETPFLAGRIDNITFTYTAQTRGANPQPTWNYQNGGRTFNSLNSNGI